ncbi:MAG: bifunctional hydroxymethylpyrimidine kinase/phosphomethylpyrimidine kinase [Candidatus Eisenbacteria bacterium]
MRKPVGLTIAGSDSSGGAGIEADLKTMCALGVYGTVALTSVTAQNTLGVTDAVHLEPALVAAQIDAVVGDLGVDAAKTGMLATVGIMEAVADRVARYGIGTLVVDPVMVATSGDPLMEADAVEAMRDLVLPLALVATPNMPEASVLSGVTVDSREAMETAARVIQASGPRYVLVKGGHMEGAAADVLFDGNEFTWLESPRIVAGKVHGTGCTLSAAIASELALGRDVAESVRRAKAFVTRGIATRLEMGKGSALVNHFEGAEEGDR